MKKRLLPIALAALLLMTLIPLGFTALAEGEYTAQFGAQMDPVDGWGLGEIAATTFNIGETAVISIDFGEEVSFGDGNYIAIETNLPNPFNGESIFTDPTVAQVLSFKLDGVEVARGEALINAEGMKAIDDSGPGLRLTLCNKWNGDILAQPVDPAELGVFTTLEVEFIIHGLERTEYTAQFGAQMDPVDGWGLGDIAATTFLIGETALIAVDFGEVVSFGDGNYIAIETNIPNPYGGVPIFSDPNTAQILSFRLDGVEVDMGNVLINAEGMEAIDGSGAGLRLTLCNKWNGDITSQPVDPTELGEFTTMEIEFVIYGLGMPVEPEENTDVPTGGKAWFGGTWIFSEGHPDTNLADPGMCDWWDFPEQGTDFEFGVPFTVRLDMGDETLTAGEAHWDGYIITVDSDFAVNPAMVVVYIQSLKADGFDIDFENANMALSLERGGLRMALTSGWTETPVVGGLNDFGTFSVLEVTMVILDAGAENPFGDEEIIDEGPITPPPPIERPSIAPDAGNNGGDSTSDGGSDNTFLIILIVGGGVVAVGAVVLVYVLFSAKKKKD
ncbi:MAG: hypothetical protein FWH17_05300 [Oscillospiraceae bacterium]|nr:hypothetical protein [Oscillospiraceae bacterium]